MKRSILVLIALTNAVFGPIHAAPLSTAFTYQGLLTENGQLANGTYDFQFRLFDVPTNGSQVPTVLAYPTVAVSNGLFTVVLDFGAGPFDGNARWLEIAVQTNGAGSFTTLTPRQPVTPTPYTLHAANAAGLTSLGNAPLEIKAAGFHALRLEGNVTSPNIIGGSSGNYVAPTVVGAVISGGGALDIDGIPYTNSVTADFGAIGGGFRNTSSGKLATIAGGYGNSCGGYASTVGGGFVNANGGFAATIAGGCHNTTPGNYTCIGGGCDNSATGIYSTVGGGYFNASSGDSACVLGGQRNYGYGPYSTIAGGGSNTNVERYCTIGGGYQNTAAGAYCTIAGGYTNVNTGFAATIGGGEQNTCIGPYAIVPGGSQNTAGDYGFAAGYRAKAYHRGSFVWADPQPYDFSSANSGEFSVRATGGVRFVSGVNTNGVPVSGVSLPSGSGSWSTLSDLNSKTNFAPVNPRELLENVARLPIQSWNYRSQSESVRHIGPTAQDFHAAFTVGEDDRHIATVDADGVALAAIQGLNQKLEERLKEKETELQDLKQRLAAIEKLLASQTIETGVVR